MAEPIGAIGAERKSTSNPVDYIKKFLSRGNLEKANAFTAYITPITTDDFTKKGQVPAPGLTEGGSVFTT